MELILKIVPIVITACAAIAAITPTQVDNKIINSILKVINMFGMNFLLAKNKDAE